MKCNESIGAYAAPKINVELISVESGFATSKQLLINETYSLNYTDGEDL